MITVMGYGVVVDFIGHKDTKNPNSLPYHKKIRHR